MAELRHLLQEPAFWVHGAFFVFLAIAFVKGRTAIKAMLDGKISDIIKEMENAQQLREEALGVLAEAKYKEQLAETRTRDMDQEAEEKIRHIENQAQQALVRTLAAQRKRMDEKIRRLENEAQRLIRESIINRALIVTENFLRQDFHEVEDRAYIQKIIVNLPQNYHEGQNKNQS